MPTAIVIGGGVAGPAVAQLLTRGGWDATVFEARPAPDPSEGLFLNLAVNGRRVLDHLDLTDRLCGDAHHAPRTVMWSASGKQLGVVPNGPAGRPDDGGLIVRRAWLHDVIRTGARSAGVEFRDGHRAVGIEDRSDSVAVTFDNGSVAEGDIVIGADGITSTVRRHITPTVTPIYTGLCGTGGYAQVPGLAPTPATQHMVFGKRSFFGYVVRDDGTVYWFANLTVDQPPEPGRQATSNEVLDEVRRLHRDDPHPVGGILANVTGAVDLYPIFRLASLPRWSKGRCVVIGDAAHATIPSAGQGASLALEDAAALAAQLTATRRVNPAAVFHTFERNRRARVERIVAYADTIDRRKKVPATRIGTALRDLLLPIFLRRARSDHRNDWIYDQPHDPAP